MGQKYTSINELYQQVRERVDLSEKLGDLSDIKKLSGELKNASKTHLAQSKRMQAHVDAMHKVKTKDSPFTAYDMEGIVDQLKKASETHSNQARKIDQHLKLPNTTRKFDKDAAKLAKIYRAGLKEKGLIEQPEHEITVGNYTTKHFFMCGSAQTTMKKHADKDGAEELTKMQDDFYKMEKDAMDAGGASDEQKEKSQELYDKIIAKAKEVGIADEVDKYMKMHLDSMLKGDPKLGFGRTDIKESIQEDGHQDVASAVRQCKIIAEDAMQILQKLQTMSPEDSLPTWWTNKLAVASNSMNKMRDYLLVPSVSEELDEDKEIPDMIKHYEDMLKSLERKKKKTPGMGFAKMKIKEIIAKLKKDLGESLELDEDAKMAKQSDDNLKSMMKKMRDAEKKDPKLPSTQFMIKRIGKEMKKRGLKEVNESKSSSGYDLYHKDFSSAMQHAYGFAKKKYGITIDPKEIDDKVATGPRKPSKGKVNKYRLKGDKGTVQIQVTNLDNKRFELNMYKEEVKMNESLKLDEAVLVGRDYKYDGKGPIKISKKMYAKVSRDSKSMIKGKPYMMALNPKTQATVLAPVEFEEVDATVQSVVEALSAGDNVREQRRMSPTARAKRDAMRDMDARKKGGDDEVKATDADREKADRNIINKIKKAADAKNEKGSFEIKFDKGPARKVPSRLASLVLQKFNKLKPADKLKFQKQAEKSYSDFLRAVKDMTK